MNKPTVPNQATLRLIPRTQHNISRKNLSEGTLRVLYRLNEEGYQAYLVGGAVRDLLLGKQPKDFDVATNATPEQVKQCFKNCRLIGRRFRLAHVFFKEELIEVATFRGQASAESVDQHVIDGRIVRDNVYGTIEEDALRRDFTVNALYYGVDDFAVRDYVGGFDDLQQRSLRLIGSAELRYREDPVRMLRAVRLAAKLGFRIDDEAWTHLGQLAPLIQEASPARLFDDILKLFFGGHAHESFRWLEASGLLDELFPALSNPEQTHGDISPLIEAALKSTDLRIAENKSVTPAFLLAALLWDATKTHFHAELSRGLDPQLAWTKASRHVIRTQMTRMAIPKRFTQPMEEIWALQSRFSQPSRKKAMRLLTHPRFRAAYDFLVLRAANDAEAQTLATWWSAIQDKTPAEAAVFLEQSTQSSAMPISKKRRPRRKKTPRNNPTSTNEPSSNEP
jgi:poly(A) polymerase